VSAAGSTSSTESTRMTPACLSIADGSARPRAVVAAWPVAVMAHGFASEDALSLEAFQVACGAAAVVGHVWPVFYQFRGGKGAATLIGVLAVVQPMALVPVLSVFALVLVLSGFVGLSTMVATASTIVFALGYVGGGIMAPFALFSVGMTAFIIWTHRGNIQRMLAGNENQFTKVMLLRRRG